MKRDYRRTATTVSMVNYHFVFCPRYRRKIFLIDGVEARFKELVRQICEQNDFDILAMECHIDYCHLFLNVPPSVSPADVMRIVKTNTSRALLKEFSNVIKTNTLWTRSYFVSTDGDVSNAMIQRYIETQKTRGSELCRMVRNQKHQHTF
jgi:putative transposase